MNSQHFKQVPGLHTDVKDAEWLAELLSYGLVKGSFIPPLPQRDLRDLTRQRTTLIRDRASVINRLQKVLEWANLKLASVVSDIGGVSGRAMLKALIAGTEDPEALTDLALMSDALQASRISESAFRSSPRPSSIFAPNASRPSRVSRVPNLNHLMLGLSN